MPAAQQAGTAYILVVRSWDNMFDNKAEGPRELRKHMQLRI